MISQQKESGLLTNHSDNTVVPNEVLRRKLNERIRLEQEKTMLALDLGVPRRYLPLEKILITDRIPLKESIRTLSCSLNDNNYDPYRDTEELVIAAKAVASMIYARDLPGVEKLALRLTVFCEILAVNRFLAEAKQIGSDTRIADAPPYQEWHKMPQAIRGMIEKELDELERKRKRRNQWQR